MDTDELRRLIRAAIVAAPLAASVGCASAPEPAREPALEPPTASPPQDVEPTSGSESTSTAAPPRDGTMDPEEFDRQWRESLRRPPPDTSFPTIVEGRPLATADGSALSALTEGDGWAGAALSLDDRVDPELMSLLARAWADVGRAEHASVASFARATLELMAVGAPAELVEAHQRASLDEIEHARTAFALAAAYGADLTPGPLEVPGPRAPKLARLARDVFVEGCVNETASALVATRAARCAADERLRAILTRIADDEAEHAALAWRTVRWALGVGGERVAAAIAAVDAPALPGIAPHPRAPALAARGILDAHARARALHDAWTGIVAPLRATMLPPPAVG